MMAMYWEEVARFETRDFTVLTEVAPEVMDPADSFEDAEDIAAIRDGSVEWFAVRVRVLYCDDVEIGFDYLGGCAYRSVREFLTSHRDPDPMNRNSSLMRAARGQNAVICHYYPNMVLEAVSSARANLRRMGGVPMRAAA